MARINNLRLTLLGVGAMNSPRYGPAGLLVEYGNARVMIDGGPGAAPKRKLVGWLVTDERGELIREIRKLTRPRGLTPVVGSYLMFLPLEITVHGEINQPGSVRISASSISVSC